MDINLLLTVIASLNFSAKFLIDLDNSSQNYFILDGKNASAHLYRENDTLKLFLRTGPSYQIREIEGMSTIHSFYFMWDGFKVNGMSMKVESKVGNLSRLDFNTMTFISPIELWNDLLVPEVVRETIYQCENLNYGWFALIVFGTGLLLKFDVIGHKIINIVMKAREEEYVEMSDL